MLWNEDGEMTHRNHFFPSPPMKFPFLCYIAVHLTEHLRKGSVYDQLTLVVLQP